MRKILICVLVGLMLVLSAHYMIKGTTKINVKGIKGIEQKNSEIEAKISELSNIITNTYQGAISNLKQTVNTLIDNKTEYENQAALSNLNNSNYVTGLEAYDIDYLWTKLGNYAKEENVVIKIDVTTGGASSNLYNLNFSVGGTYVGATDFIYDIENDTKLGFKIDNFKMIASGSAEVIATFTCKDIPLSVGNIESSSSTEGTTNSEENGANSNTQKTTTTNTTANTSSASQNYGISDPNKSNLTSIDQVVNTNN